jgi:hypothetical protein
MRKSAFIFAVLVMLLTINGGVYAQACGHSVRTIRLEYPAVTKPVALVTYQLFYVAPKNDDNSDWKKRLEFISNFFYDSPTAKELPFWSALDDGEEFLKIPVVKAARYLKDYKLNDFQKIYSQQWHDHHLSQLKGKFTKGTLELKTAEGDTTAFLMKVTARGYRTQYFLSDFLGGCFPGKGDPNVSMKIQKIVMEK